MAVTLSGVLEELRAAYPVNADRGKAFERLVHAVFETDPTYRSRFTKVWMWSDWPDRNDAPDTGIDLVAETVDGGVSAIQCKFFEEDRPLDKKDIDSFFTASGKAPFTERIIVSTTERWTKHAEDACADQQIPVARIGVAELAAAELDWSAFAVADGSGLQPPKRKSLRAHQEAAIADVMLGFETSSRGRLIMACGTGKTFTALRLAERVTQQVTAAGDRDGAHVLFLVPSIALLNQTLREWTSQAHVRLRSFAVCSDTKVGKRAEDIRAHDLLFPATTDAAALVRQVRAADERDGDDGVPTMTVVFSTYQSIEAVAAAQAAGLPDFDLIVCDEAHRTTGVTLAGEDASTFQLVHDQGKVRGDRRLYMTATPRLFSDDTKTKAAENAAVLCSMDDEAIYGPEFHRLGFGHAVEAGLLTDYKVLILQVDEEQVAASFQAQLADDNNELNLDDAAKIVGCWNGLAKRGNAVIAGDGFGGDPLPMQRAVAFCSSIKDSKALTDRFAGVVSTYTGYDATALNCEIRHVDGTMNALSRNRELEWLKADAPENTCRILTNARCLTEGVDVPDLDAVLFLSARSSQVDVVQAVGRVMRKADGKEFGYIILPIAVPAGMSPEAALADHKRYKVVWQVLQALRAHDDRFNAIVNQIELNKRDADRIGMVTVGEFDPDGIAPEVAAKATQLSMPLREWRDAIYARIVKKVGDRAYWEQWTDDVRRIAEQHIARIKAALADPARATAFDRFVEELRGNLNPGISADDAIEMLAQHVVTRPVFDALFAGYEFSANNPVSQTMQAMLDELEDQSLEKESAPLEDFYDSVRRRAEGVDNHEGRQTVITELYERFFKKALPKTADAFGIVYTPIEIVDLILRFTDEALQQHFGTCLSDEGVQILDPFTGTGTFMVRLLQGGFIRPKDLLRKYTSELHANEILLLAYYIAAINIEATFHQLQAEDGDEPGEYVPFPGIVLADTFQMGEGDGTMDADLFPENHERAARQQAQDIRVIIGNPPYSAGQDSANDANQNRKYPTLDGRIRDTYVAQASGTNLNSLYDSYIRAFRWASDRIGESGLVCFVSNGGWIDGNAADGLRKAFAAEFDHIYVVNFRGNQRTAGEQSKREGGKVFGSGSRSTVAVALLVRTGAGASARIHYRDVGDYLTRGDKLAIAAQSTLGNVPWEAIAPNVAGDWTHQRDERFNTYRAVAGPDGIFELISNGVKTQRDAWCWNFSRDAVVSNTGRMIDVYNDHVDAYQRFTEAEGAILKSELIDHLLDLDPKRISWTANLKDGVRSGRAIEHDLQRVVAGAYRPFTRQWIYFHRSMNERVYQQPKLFPDGGDGNFGISLTGPASHFEFSAVMTSGVPDLHVLDSGQYFPRWRYELPDEGTNPSLFEPEAGPRKIDNISPATLADYQAAYGDHVTSDDVFFYVYGLLHSPEYRQRYAADLKRQLPRIPKAVGFAGFAEAGRKLADLHLGYETVEPYPLDDPSLDWGPTADPARFRVEKMKYRSKEDHAAIVVNAELTLAGIPEEAHRYLLGPRTPLDWIIDRYQIRTHKDSGIVNDPNDWCAEHGDPRYIVDLIKRIVTVSVQTVAIVEALPALDVLE